MKPGDVNEPEAAGEYNPYANLGLELQPERTVEPLRLSTVGFDEISRANAEWEEANKKYRDPQIWARSAASGRPLSDAILEPIRVTLRAKKVVSVHYFHTEVPLTDEAMEDLFGDGLEALEKQLGRLLLDAVVRGDSKFKEQVDDAVKDANALFHRTAANGAFYRWSKLQPRRWRVRMSRSKVREAFEASHRPLSSKEWAEIRRVFHLHNLPREKTGRPPKQSAK